ncbi:MAG: hypothetical protein RLZZ158_1198 [Cyanobacteriota bacterium]
MAVGGAQQQPAFLAGPFLGSHQFSRINGKALQAFRLRLPAVEARPHQMQHPSLALAGSQQQGAAFLGQHQAQVMFQNHQPMRIEAHQSW